MNTILDELIEKIFHNLDDKSLLCASRVNKRWREIIISSRPLLERLTLTFNLCNKKYKEFSGLGGSYKNAKIHMMNESTKIATKVLKSIHLNAKSIEKFELMGSLRRYEVFSTFLLPLTNITHLTITHFFPEEEDNEIFDKIPHFTEIHLPNLKYLEVYNSIKFYPLLKTHQITTLKAFEERRFLPMLYLNTMNYQQEFNRLFRGFITFLKSCNLLKYLYLDSIKYTEIFTEKNYPFKLEKGSFILDGLEEELLIMFLKPHKETLKSLTVNVQPTSKIILFALNDLELSHFDVDLYNTPVDQFKIDMTNFTIKSLDIPELPSAPRQGCSLGPRTPRRILAAPGEKLIDACINVEALGMYDFHHDVIKSMCKLQKLKILRMHYAPDALPEEDFKLKMLEHLEVDQIVKPEHAQHVINFLPHLPSLKFLKLNKFEACTEQVFLDLASALPLSVVELHLGTEIKFSGDMMHKLNDMRKEGHAIERLSFLDNGSRTKEFASFKVAKFYFRAYEKESGYFEINRLTICESRQMLGSFKNKKDDFDAIECPKK